MKLKVLVGNGRKIGLLAAPFLVAGLILNILFPSVFEVGGPAKALKVISMVLLVPGIVIWIWSVLLGVLVGIVVYIGSRMFSPEEEQMMSKIFGSAWEQYCKKVWLPWL